MSVQVTLALECEKDNVGYPGGTLRSETYRQAQPDFGCAEIRLRSRRASHKNKNLL